MVPSDDFYNADKTFKSADEIRRMLSYLGVKPEQQVYTYCGGGIAASVPFFAARFILDYPQVKLYQESELGWLRDERVLPYWTYDAPLLIRETDWLKTWGGKMFRMYGVSEVSMIDVRPADVFKQGHMPYALNIPADVFKSNLKNPEKLAEILGQAGVNASHEAVVISDAGLNSNSALAFFMLESLGQKRVSVFMDSIDKWLERGLEVTKDATAVGPKKGARGFVDTSDDLSDQCAQAHADRGPQEHAGAVPEDFYCFRQERACKDAGRQGGSCAVHRSSEC